MATAREENLLCLIEVMKNEAFLIGQVCYSAKWLGRCELTKLAREEGMEYEDLLESDLFRGYDQPLEEAVERILNIIHLAEDRLQELNAPRVCEGD
jgi:hypothetical protein